jgi:hypothetical protein
MPMLDKMRWGVIRMMKNSRLLIQKGVLMMNANSCREVNTLELPVHVLETQKLSRALVLCMAANSGKKVTINATGEVAKVCANPVAKFINK